MNESPGPVWPRVPYVGVGCIVMRQDKILLVKSHSGWWSTPGGHLDFGETPADALPTPCFAFFINLLEGRSMPEKPANLPSALVRSSRSGLRTILALLAIATATSSAAATQDSWVRANVATPRLAPAMFPELPVSARLDLDQRGCRIPQSFERGTQRRPNNVVAGMFTAPGARDWAVLCSIRDTSRILVYREGVDGPPDSLAVAADHAYLQTIGEGRIGFSRSISRVSADQVRRRNSGRAGEINHDGIADAFVGKASVIRYRAGARWLEIPGADAPRPSTTSTHSNGQGKRD